MVLRPKKLYYFLHSDDINLCSYNQTRWIKLIETLCYSTISNLLHLFWRFLPLLLDHFNRDMCCHTTLRSFSPKTIRPNIYNIKKTQTQFNWGSRNKSWDSKKWTPTTFAGSKRLPLLRFSPWSRISTTNRKECFQKKSKKHQICQKLTVLSYDLTKTQEFLEFLVFLKNSEKLKKFLSFWVCKSLLQ